MQKWLLLDKRGGSTVLFHAQHSTVLLTVNTWIESGMKFLRRSHLIQHFPSIHIVLALIFAIFFSKNPLSFTLRSLRRNTGQILNTFIPGFESDEVR